jgi:FkbM family methyltransferase
MFDCIFQKFCNIFPHYIVRKHFFYKKLFYYVFCIFKFVLKKPVILNFKFYKFIAFPQKFDYSRFLLTRGDLPDPGELEFIKRNIKNKKVLFIDCGSNYGSYSIPIATFNKKSDVYAFDASRSVEKTFFRNLKLNNLKNIKYYNLAVGDKSKTVIFHEDMFNDIISSTGGGSLINKIENKNLDYKIEMIRLDKFFSQSKLKKYELVFIKIDLEGHDIKAIYGSLDIIKKIKTIIMFEFSKMIFKNNFVEKNFLTFLKRNNLIITDLNLQFLTLEKLKARIASLDEAHQTCGNYLLLNKNLIKELNDKNNNLIRNK